MNLENFRRNISVINGVEGSSLRNRYIQKFVLTDKEYFQKYILTMRTFSDGICYTGYLWDCLKEVEVIDFTYIYSMINALEKVYVLWDIHSKDRIFIEDYWKFKKMIFYCWILMYY